MELSAVDAEKWSPLLKWISAPIETSHPAPESDDNYELVRSIRQRQRRLTRDEVKRVVERYEAGATVYELATEFGCNRGTISERLKAAGVTMRFRVATPEQVDEMVRLYESGLSLVKVGEQVGASAHSVLNYLRERGIATGDSHGHTR